MKNIAEKTTRREFFASLGLAAIALSLFNQLEKSPEEELKELLGELRFKFTNTSKAKQQTALEMLEGFVAETDDKDLSVFFLVVANNFRRLAK